MGGKKEYKCKNEICGLNINRDKNGVRNNLLEKLQELIVNVKPGADGKVDHKRLHPDGILTSGDKKIFIEFSRCPENLASERIKTKVRRLREVAKLHNAGFCVVVLTKQEGKILEEGSISIFDEYGKQSAKTRFTRQRSTFDEHHCYEDDVYAKVTTGRLQKNVRALSRTLQTRGLAILLHALAGGQEELKRPRNSARIKRQPRRVARQV